MAAKGKRSKLAQERLNVVDQMLRACYTHRAIVTVLCREWQLKERQIYNYIRKVYERWEQEAPKTVIDRTGLRRAQLEGVLEKAMRDTPPDLRTALAALDRLCRVDGCYAPETQNINMTTVEHRARRMTSDEQRRELDELFRKYTAVTNRKPKAADGDGGTIPN